MVEYEYRIHSQLFWELRDWYAQCEIPVVYAKLDMNIPNFLIFNIEDHGIQRLTYTCTVGTLKCYHYKTSHQSLADGGTYLFFVAVGGVAPQPPLLIVYSFTASGMVYNTPLAAS